MGSTSLPAGHGLDSYLLEHTSARCTRHKATKVGHEVGRTSPVKFFAAVSIAACQAARSRCGALMVGASSLSIHSSTSALVLPVTLIRDPA